MDLNDMVMFAHVAREQSFSRAAERLGLSTSALSKAVRRLEDTLDARLLRRTTRSLSLTEAGDRYFEHCARILDEIAAANLSIAQLSTEPAGLLRITAPVSFGALHLVPAIEALVARYPLIQVDLQLQNALSDLVEESYDVAIRVLGELPDSGMAARRLAPDRWVVCATSGYFEQYGRPRAPEDLRAHRCLIYTLRGSRWSFCGPHGDEVVQVSGPLLSNNGLALQRAAVAGLGVAMLPEFIVGQLVREGALEEVLAEHAVRGRWIYAILPQRDHVAPKVRAFVDLLAERLLLEPWSAEAAPGAGDRRTPAPARRPARRS